jgi:glutathione synthase/RimK-type ligase-like ATP-grasp enzyme
MILVFGALLDGQIGCLLHRMATRGVSFRLLDPRQCGSLFELEWELDGSDFAGRLVYDGTVTPLSEVRSAYAHILRVPRSEPRSERLIGSFLESAPILVANRPSSSATNFSKPWQLQLVAEAGFEVPRTLVTYVPERALDFFERCRRRVVYKSLSSRSSIVRRMTEADLGRLERLAAGPVQFQEWIPGTDVRVHVVGSRLFATEIDSEAVDYRYASEDGFACKMRGISLPDEIAERCFRLARSVGMAVTGIDLRRSLDGRWFCFEANPTPGYYFYEQFTGQRIADALIDLLSEGGTNRL